MATLTNFLIIRVKTQDVAVYTAMQRTNLSCCSFLITILLFSFTTSTMARFTDKDCNKLIPNNTQCECLASAHDVFIQCPAKVAVPQIKVKIIEDMQILIVKIEYNDTDSNAYKHLPAMDIGVVDTLFFSHYSLSSESISHLLNHLGITHLHHILIELSDNLKVNFTREHLTGLAELPSITLLNIDLPHIPDDIFVDLPNLKMLALSSANIQFTPNFFSKMVTINFPYLNGKNMQRLPKGIFRNKHKLEELYIFFSQLKEINKYLFLEATSIRHLELRNNTIEHIPNDTFASLTDLEEINLSNNDLRELPPKLFDCNKKLVTMQITGNRVALKSIPSAFFGHLRNLRLVNITCGIEFDKIYKHDVNGYVSKTMRINCGLSKIPADIFANSTDFDEISLARNELVTVDAALFARQFGLKYLDFSHNRLRTLPDKLFSATSHLIELYLSHNQLTEITSGIFANLYNLKILYMDNNRLKIINPDAFSQTKSLIFINMESNHISFARNDSVTVGKNLFAKQYDLHYLNLSHNNLQSLPDELFSATGHLIELYLSHNQLTEISSGIFLFLYDLKVLYMDNNRLKIINSDAFVQTKSLIFINMENNHINLSDFIYNVNKSYPIDELQSPFRYLAKLQTLNLRNNSLSCIFKDWRHKMNELQVLDLSYNNITSTSHSDLLFRSKNELSINLTYNQISIISFPNMIPLTDSLNRSTSVLLNSNPFECDCNLLPFIQYVQGALPHVTLNFIIDELVCDKPENLKGLKVSDIEPKALICFLDFMNSERCPSDCVCWRRSFDSVLVINCGCTKKTEVPVLPNVQPLGLRSIELHIENNDIYKLPTASTIGYADVTKLYAKGNNLFQIDVNNLPRNVEYLDLSHNNLKTFSNETLNFFNQSASPIKIALSLNPWNCECGNKPLMEFVRNSRIRILDSDNVNCTSPINYNMTDYINNNDVCQSHDKHVGIISAILGSISFFLFPIAVLAVLYYKYQTEVKVWMYKYRICSCCVNEEELDKYKIYDAFVSFSHKDEEFVAKHLVPELEEGPIRFKLCIHVRDFVIGECIPDQIVRAIDTSRRTIIVLSENFINSVWAQMEFRLAHQAGLNEGRARVIVILYGEIGDTKLLDKELQAYLATTTYLEWGNPWFWDKLRYAMPHPSKKLSNEVGSVEQNVIPMVQVSRETD